MFDPYCKWGVGNGKETRRQGDKETRRQGDKETRRRGYKGIRNLPKIGGAFSAP
jgi:hypothetical protein